MNIIRLTSIKNKIKLKKPIVLSIGNFDGIHKGHQYVIHNLLKIAHKYNAYSTIMCFEPQPKEFFLHHSQPTRITPFRDKMIAIKEQMIEQLICLKFNQKFSHISGEKFIYNILVNLLDIKHILTGYDFHFGYQRQSNYNKLNYFGKKYGFNTNSMHSVLNNNTRISSSQIRVLLKQNKLNEAQTLLGKSYTISGRIHHGGNKGHQIGFPTINISILSKIALNGVYIVNIYWNNNIYFGIANIGIKPTIGINKKLLEIHIFNFHYNIYKQHVKIEFLTFLRYEKKFICLDQLKTQIIIDKIIAYDWIKQYKQNKTQ